MESPIVQPTRELAGGTMMPVLGLGVWQMAAGRETEQAVEWELEAGYRHIDTASMYREGISYCLQGLATLLTHSGAEQAPASLHRTPTARSEPSHERILRTGAV
jgi:aryl-alcohol dehydrogenase-like predicted oxidoreductase